MVIRDKWEFHHERGSESSEDNVEQERKQGKDVSAKLLPANQGPLLSSTETHLKSMLR